MKNYLIIILISFGCFFNIAGQVDSTMFSYSDFIAVVKSHHPITYQAKLQIDKGKSLLQEAKGSFDPRVKSSLSQKYFDGKQYYSYLNAGLKIPTWYGVTLEGGYDNNEGYYLNSESQNPLGGLWYAGATVNLGKGLFIDKRRAELQQAKIYLESSKLMQKMILNQLLYDAGIAYYDWEKSYNKVVIYQNGVINAIERFNSVKFSVFYGDKPAVDTLKALVQVQNRRLKLEQATLELLNKKYFVETFLWQEGNIPLEMDSTLIPQNYITSLSNKSTKLPLENVDFLVNNHPEMLYYVNDIEMAKIDFRQNKENLKPSIELKYNVLSEVNVPTVFGGSEIKNYNWGAKVTYPLFTRKERAKLNLSQIKINEKESQILVKKNRLRYKLITAHNKLNSTEKQTDLYTLAMQNYKLLFDAELKLFNAGESTLFLVNFREKSYIESQIKRIELLFSNYIAVLQFRFQTVRL